MAMLHQGHGNAASGPWQCSSRAMAMLQQGHGNAASGPWQCRPHARYAGSPSGCTSLSQVRACLEIRPNPPLLRPPADEGFAPPPPPPKGMEKRAVPFTAGKGTYSPAVEGHITGKVRQHSRVWRTGHSFKSAINVAMSSYFLVVPSY